MASAMNTPTMLAHRYRLELAAARAGARSTPDASSFTPTPMRSLLISGRALGLDQAHEVADVPKRFQFRRPETNPEPHLRGHNQRDVGLAVPAIDVLRRGLGVERDAVVVEHVLENGRQF